MIFFVAHLLCFAERCAINQFHLIWRVTTKSGRKVEQKLPPSHWKSALATFVKFLKRDMNLFMNIYTNFETWTSYEQTFQSIPIGFMYGIFTYIWLICMANVGKYTIHGSYGIDIQLFLVLQLRFFSQGVFKLSTLGIQQPSPWPGPGRKQCYATRRVSCGVIDGQGTCGGAFPVRGYVMTGRKWMNILPPKNGWFPKGNHMMGILTFGEL